MRMRLMIKARLICVMGTLCLFSSGCFPGFSIRNIDQVPKSEASLWEKPGSTLWDVRRALLECGALSPTGGTIELMIHEGYVDEASRRDHSVQVSACMEKAGYTNNVAKRYGAQSDVELTCNTWKKKYTLPACQPGAPVMERSAERRLNSNYCKRRRDYEFCKATAVNPAACDRRDYSKNEIEPVCLP
jgi:hypothetical protein